MVVPSSSEDEQLATLIPLPEQCHLGPLPSVHGAQYVPVHQ